MKKQILVLLTSAVLLASCQSKESSNGAGPDSVALKTINDTAFSKHIAILASDDFEGLRRLV